MAGEDWGDPIETGPVSKILYKHCLCCACGIVAKCTPSFDFYTREKDGPSGALYCYHCLIADAGLPAGAEVMVEGKAQKEYKN